VVTPRKLEKEAKSALGFFGKGKRAGESGPNAKMKDRGSPLVGNQRFLQDHQNTQRQKKGSREKKKSKMKNAKVGGGNLCVGGTLSK